MTNFVEQEVIKLEDWAKSEASKVFTPQTLDVLGTTIADIEKICAVVGADIAAVNAAIAGGTAPIWAILSVVLPLLMPSKAAPAAEPAPAAGDTNA